MNTSKLLTGAIAGGIVAMVIGYLVFGLALSGYMAENASMKDPPDFLWLSLGNLAFAGLLSYIFLQWAGIKTASGGAKAGALIAFLSALSFNWIWHGTSDLFTGGVVATLVDAIGAAVSWGVGGAAIGWIIDRRGES